METDNSDKHRSIIKKGSSGLRLTVGHERQGWEGAGGAEEERRKGVRSKEGKERTEKRQQRQCAQLWIITAGS